MDLKLFILLIIAVTSSVAVNKNYEGYKVYNVIPKTLEEVNILENVQNSALGESWEVQFGVNQIVKIMVAPEKQNKFEDTLKKVKIEVTEIIENLQRAINEQLKPSHIRSSDNLLSFNWNQYHDLDAVYNWLDELALAYPNIVSTVVIGRSFENRDIKGVIIDFKPERENKLIGMLEGTLHAREWIATATVTYIIKEFLTSTDPEVRTLAENFQWHIFPVANPDGYVYTFTTNRMWRKNRSTESFKNCSVGVDNDMSNGVDLNRNFDFMWMTIGASDDSCTNTYAGPSPNSEPETRSIISYVQRIKERGDMIYYIAFHSYTQLIVIPYSHLDSATSVGQPSNYADMYEIAARGAEALSERFGTVFRVGVSAEVLYPMSGTSFDWVKYAADVPISYLIELRDLGEYGFLLPANQIIPTSQEIMDALVEMDKTAISLGYYYENSATGVYYSLSVVMFGVLIAIYNR